MGEIFLRGFGVQRDPMIAHEYFTNSADHGNADAMYALGLMNESGDGVNVDYGKAREIMTAAASAGSSQAEEWLEKRGQPIKLFEEIPSTAC